MMCGAVAAQILVPVNHRADPQCCASKMIAVLIVLQVIC